VHYFAAKTALRAGPELPYFSRTAMEKLRKHGWPGNISELKDIIERSVLESSGSKIENVELRHVLPEISDSLSPLEASERDVISRYLAQNNFNKNRTRLQLGITINTLNAKMEKYGIVTR
jgi:DNA-binding NtrC family response regulator